MLAEERRKLILSEIMQNKSVLVTELSEKYGVTVVTIRKDLDSLEKTGLISKTFGGALLNETAPQKSEKLFQTQVNSRDLGIVKEALNYIQDGQTILMEQGELIYELAKQVSSQRKNLTVITNSLNTAVEMSESNNDVIVTGGILRGKTMTMIGYIAERVLDEIDGIYSFIEADGISEDLKLKTSRVIESRTEMKFLENAQKTIVLARSECFSRSAPSQLADIDESMIIITDSEVKDTIVEKFNASGLNLIIARGEIS